MLPLFDFKIEQKFKNLKQQRIAPMSGLSSATDPVQLGPSTLISICPIGALKVRQLKNGYIAVTQPHLDGLRSNFTRRYSVTP